MYRQKGTPPVITVRDYSWLAKCSEKHTRDLLARGELKGVKIGRVWRIPRAEAYRSLGLDLDSEVDADE